MSVRITSQEGCVALFDSTTGIAFGPTFTDASEAQHFLTWLREDPRTLTPTYLRLAYERWDRDGA